jgi:hypothetical protein
MSDAPESPSAWSRLPTDEAGTVRPLTARAGTTAQRLAGQVKDGVRRASEALAAPRETDLESLVAGTDLPEIQGEPDVIAALAIRLDREADFWRALALRSLARAAWADRLAQIMAVLSGTGAMGLAGLAGFAALVGASPERAVLLLAGTASLAAAALIVSMVAGRARRGQREVISDALGRADLAELRLHRVSVVLAARKLDEAQQTAALLRLERDVGAPVR